MSENSLRLRGKVAAVLGDNVNTDLIYPGRFLNITDRAMTAEHLFELACPDLRGQIRPGDFLVAGKNFGCGSSREQATAAVKYAGVGAVIAASFARIFYRNSINLGLPLVVSKPALSKLRPGDKTEIDLAAGIIRNLTTGESIEAAPLDPRAVELLEAGGLIPYLRQKHAA
ncbi:MAG: 3-isopropylmalate dehydratase small subunit [Acidobacteria bacterium]|nr:3-isopropylmalate dehydratase small subunit [Acidobacteriota bacterium]